MFFGADLAEQPLYIYKPRRFSTYGALMNTFCVCKTVTVVFS